MTDETSSTESVDRRGARRFFAFFISLQFMLVVVVVVLAAFRGEHNAVLQVGATTVGALAAGASGYITARYIGSGVVDSVGAAKQERQLEDLNAVIASQHRALAEIQRDLAELRRSEATERSELGARAAEIRQLGEHAAHIARILEESRPDDETHTLLIPSDVPRSEVAALVTEMNGILQQYGGSASLLPD